MELLTKTLVLCLVLGFINAAPMHPEAQAADVGAVPDRCAGIEFDAITPDEEGTTFFFKGGYLWKGFYGPAQRSNEVFKLLDDIHQIGQVDAAFRMHNTENQDVHDHIFFFQNDKVFSYYNHTLEDGYPKAIQEDFPEVPNHLDAAVECPKGECRADSVLFFKGQDVYVYDILTKTVKTKTWSHLPACSSVFRWLEHYYCFHGNNFTRFHPISGEVSGQYPKDARNYFMRCSGFGHGGDRKAPKCSDVKLDAITTDDAGKTYFFAGPIFMRLDTSRDGLHAFPITRNWKELRNGVDAVFSNNDKMYLIKGDQVYIYKTGAHYTLIEGYPKTLKEELSVEGHVDAAFLCPNQDKAYIIQGDRIREVSLTASPRVITQELTLPFTGIDASLCGQNGIQLFKGSQYYDYETSEVSMLSKPSPAARSITSEMMGCQD
ncbi:hemopexin [Pholidichthys leucotaenia]